MKKNIKYIVLLLLCIIIPVKADSQLLEITNVEIADKAMGVESTILSIDHLTINAKTTFYEENDYVTYNISFKNNSKEDYLVGKISNSQENQHINLNIDKHGLLIKAGEEKNLAINMVYDNPINEDYLVIDTPFNVEMAHIENPYTYKNIISVLILIIILISLSIILSKKKTTSLILLIILIIPYLVNASSKTINITFNNEITLLTKTTTFLPGKEVNTTWKKLASDTEIDYQSGINTIVAIKREKTINEDLLENTNIISTTDSLFPIYTWYNKEKETIYWYTEAKKIYMNEDGSYMFQRFSSVKDFDLEDINTSKVTTMEHLFFECASVEDLDVTHFNTGKVVNMLRAFASMPQLTHLDVSNFNTENVINMNRMFAYNLKLPELNLSSFNTSNVTDMGFMFRDVSVIKEIDLSSFDTSNVTNMEYMFCNDRELEKITFSEKFDTSKVTNMNLMFYNCPKLKELDLSSFITDNVTTMTHFVVSDLSLKTIYVSKNLNLDNIPNNTSIFGGNTNLVGGNGTVFNNSNNPKTYARIDTPDTPGYFTLKE